MPMLISVRFQTPPVTSPTIQSPPSPNRAGGAAPPPGRRAAARRSCIWALARPGEGMMRAAGSHGHGDYPTGATITGMMPPGRPAGSAGPSLSLRRPRAAGLAAAAAPARRQPTSKGPAPSGRSRGPGVQVPSLVSSAILHLESCRSRRVGP